MAGGFPDFTQPMDVEQLVGFTLGSLAPQAKALIEEYLGRKIIQDTYTEFYAGKGRQLLVLRQRPVQSITSIFVDELAYWGDAPGAFGNSTLLVEGTDFALDRDQADGSSRSGLVYKINGYWPVPVTHAYGEITPAFGRIGNIKITYVAGHVEEPPDLKLALSLTMAHLMQLIRRGGLVQSESDDDIGVSYDLAVPQNFTGDILPPHVKRILARSKNVAVA